MVDIKKEFITNLLEKSIDSAKEHLVKIGMGDVEVFDSIDKHLIVKEMEAVCSPVVEVVEGESVASEIPEKLAQEAPKPVQQRNPKPKK